MHPQPSIPCGGMPTDIQVTLQGRSGLSKDRYVNTLHFQGDDWNVAALDELWTKYVSFIDAVGGGLAQGGHMIKAYNPGPNPGGPYLQKTYSRAAAHTGSSPTEVAVCLSYATVEDPEQSVPRRRGRIYCGPFSTVHANAERPGATVIDAVLDLGEGIAQVGFAATRTWALYSQLDASYHKIESIWCDDAWDTQRRRGLAPTTKTVRNVQ